MQKLRIKNPGLWRLGHGVGGKDIPRIHGQPAEESYLKIRKQAQCSQAQKDVRCIDIETWSILIHPVKF